MVQCLGPTLTTDEIQNYREKYSFRPNLEEISVFYHLIANPVRIKVLHLLQEQGQICVCDLKDIFEITAPAMSQHLAKLKAHKMVQSKKMGQTVFYFLTNHPFLDFVLEGERV